MENFDIAIIEDEESAFLSLEDMLQRYERENDTKFIFSYYRDAESFLQNYRPSADIVFMDIELSGMDGMRAAKKLRAADESVVIIFITNMRQYAIKGYEVGALNYILKPVNYHGLAMTLNRALRAVQLKKNNTIVLKIENSYRVIGTEKIKFVEVLNHYVTVSTIEGKLTYYGNLVDIEKKLLKKNFFRCSSSFIVNMKYITDITGNDIIIGEDVIKISRSKKKEFFKLFAAYLGEVT